MKILSTGLYVGFFSVLSATLFAGTTTRTVAKDVTPVVVAEPTPLDLLTLDSSYVFESDFKDNEFGSQSGARNIFQYGHRFSIGDDNAWPTRGGHWFMRLGVAYERYDFSGGDAPVPNHLQGAAAVVALEYMLGCDTAIQIQSEPGVYFSGDVRSNSFDAPTIVKFVYDLVPQKFYIGIGARVSILSHYHIIPAVGFRWHIVGTRSDPVLTLDAALPEPRLIWQCGKTFQYWVGGEIVGGAFRTDNSDVTPEKLRGAVVDYHEYRAAVGVTYNFSQCSSIDLAAGYAFDRTFDFHNAGEKYKLEPAPFVRAQVKLAF